jgi:predicted methyltransferase
MPGDALASAILYDGRPDQPDGRSMRHTHHCLVVLLLTGGAAHAEVDHATLAEHSVAEHRPAEQRARNAYRHPVQTLSWLGIEPEMTVVEIWPGNGGWYTGILAPYLRGSGTFYAAGFVVEGSDVPDWRKRYQQALEERLAAHLDIYDEAKLAPIGSPDHFNPRAARQRRCRADLPQRPQLDRGRLRSGDVRRL